MPVASSPVGGFAQRAVDFRNIVKQASSSELKVKPEKEAFWFYLLEHTMHSLEKTFAPGETLPPEALDLANEYHQLQSVICRRSLYYLLLITTREARHNNSKTKCKTLAKDKFGFDPMNVLSTVDSADVDVVTKALKNNCQNVPAGPYAKWMSECFLFGHSGGFGGKPWSDIALCLSRFLNGETNIVLMTDISWALAHNNGPIFNKGMFYSMYDKKSLMEILDVQRAGQIPALLQTTDGSPMSKQYQTKSMVTFCEKVYSVTGDPDFAPGQEVNWAKVAETGVQSYSYDGTTHSKGTGPVKKKPSPLQKIKPDYDPDKHLQLMPGVHVDVIPSPRTKAKPDAQGVSINV
jgi:hypothetical protein